MKVISHGYEEAAWWYSEFITKKEWKRKTAWITLPASGLEYAAALKECYRGLQNDYWSLSRLCELGSYQYNVCQRRLVDLWREYLHIDKTRQSIKDFPEYCEVMFENQTPKEPFVIE